MYEHYTESRIGLPVVGGFVVLQVIAVILGLYYFGMPTAIVITLFLLFMFLNLFSLQVVVSSDSLRLNYGLGLFSYSVPLEFIQSCEIVPNNYWTWFYDTSRGYVLKLNLRDGSKKIIGVGDPKRMIELISAHLRR